MLKQKNYFCGICNTIPDQLSHHKSHLETDKHKTINGIMILQIKQLSIDDLQNKYNTSNIEIIIDGIETISRDFLPINNENNENVENNENAENKLDCKTKNKNKKLNSEMNENNQNNTTLINTTLINTKLNNTTLTMEEQQILKDQFTIS